MIIIYELLRAEIAKQKKLQGKTNADLEIMTGIKKKTIDAFMCGVRNSETTAQALSRALNIER